MAASNEISVSPTVASMPVVPVSALQDISGSTRVVGVFGHPVTHSLSPAMHNAAFKALELPYVYVPFAVAPDAIGSALRGLPALGIVGVNLTIPHKESALPFLDEITDEARIVGAVNTVHCLNGLLIGDNTDGRGFYQPLVEAGVTVRGQTVVVLGAGGAARAVVYRLVREGANVILANRTRERAERLAHDIAQTCASDFTSDRSGKTDFQANASRLTIASASVSPEIYASVTSSHERNLGKDAVQVVTWDDSSTSQNALRDALAQARVLVNTTRVGMVPNADAMPDVPLNALPPTALVYDLVYNPIETRLLHASRRRGLSTLTGVKMLVYQGAASFERWTGVWPPTEVMEQAVIEGLSRK